MDEANHKVVPMCDCQSTTGLTRREAIAGSLVAGSLVAAPGDAFYPMLREIRSRTPDQYATWSTVLKPARRLGVVTP